MSLYGVIDLEPITPYKERLVAHLVATLIYLSQNYSYYISGDRSRLISLSVHSNFKIIVVDDFEN